MLSTIWASLILIDTFKAKIQESGKPCSEFKTKAFFATREDDPSTKRPSTHIPSRVPSRMVSDQMINIFFQEWAPLFPVVHRPTMLKVYADYVNDPKDVKDNHSLVQLNLIFGIAALSAEVRMSDLNSTRQYAYIQQVEQTECSGI